MPETGTATAKTRLCRGLALPGRGGLGFRNVSQRIDSLTSLNISVRCYWSNGGVHLPCPHQTLMIE